MNTSINWDAFVRPLDVFKIYRSPHCLREWVSYKRIGNGVTFSCKLDEWPESLTSYKQQLVNVKVEVIYEDVIRFRLGMDDLSEKHSEMLVHSKLPATHFDVEESENLITLKTRRMRAEFSRYPWQMQVYQKDESKPFFSQRMDDRAYGPAYETSPVGVEVDNGVDQIAVRESVAVSPGESFYGFGEHFTPLNKWGQELEFWALDAGNVSSFRAYKNIPFFMSSEGYGVFINSSYPMVFQMGNESSISYSFHVMEKQLDYFLIYGPDYKDILKRYCGLTGYAPVPPKWSFGFWISRCGYKSRAEVDEVIHKMREHDFPCDVISLDPWWMGDGPWTTFEWDRGNFPNPSEMIHNLREQGIRTCLWVHPYLPTGTKAYKEANEKGYLVQKPGDTAHAKVMEAFSGKDLAAIDFTNPSAVSWFQSKLQILIDEGVATFKTDFGEQAPIDAVYHDGRKGLEMHNLYPLLYNGAAYELTKQNFGRGLVWGRSAYAGSQRYPVQWGGDSYSSFDQMACQLRGLLSYGMSGVPFCSHDIGGFDYPPVAFDRQGAGFTHDSIHMADFPKDPEVYIRWLQFGVFSSHSRAHGKQPREPWTYGEEAEQIARKYLKLRYRLLPYIYSEAVECTKNCLPMVRPLVLEFPSDPNTHHIDLEYMFGSQFLVAPMVTGGTKRNVYIPEGMWVDFWTKTVLEGGCWIDVDAPLDILPLWVKAGAILPFGPEMDFVDQKKLDPLTIKLFHPASIGEYVIHDEDRPDIQVYYERMDKALNITTGETPGKVEIILHGVEVGEVESINREVFLNRISAFTSINFIGSNQVKLNILLK